MGVWKKLAIAFASVLVVCSVFFVVGCGGNGGGTDRPEKLYLFGTAVGYTGDLDGRTGADAKCLTDANMPADATVAYAFISVTENDCIANMPANYNFPADIPIVAPDGVTVIADNWADLLDGDIDVSLGIDKVLPESKDAIWWSGSDLDGTLNADNCNGWTENGVLIDGRVGRSDTTGQSWIFFDIVTADSHCRMLGIAY